MSFTKTQKIIAAAAGGAVLVLGLLWFFQEQGFLKVFPTAIDREMSRALQFDESKFKAAVGVSEEEFQKQVQELYARRDQAKGSRKDATAWFRFGYQLNYLGDHFAAARAWEIALKLQPENFVVAGNLAGNYQYFLKDYGRAEFYYQKALEIQPAYTAAWQGLADLYRFNWKERSHLLEPLLLEAAQRDPNAQSAYFSILVGFFAENGDLVKARDYLAKVRALSPAAADELLETYPALRS